MAALVEGRFSLAPQWLLIELPIYAAGYALLGYVVAICYWFIAGRRNDKRTTIVIAAGIVTAVLTIGSLYNAYGPQ